MNNYPDIVLKIKQLNKKGKTAVVFARNNISFKDFKHVDEGFIYTDSFNLHGVKGTITIKLYSHNLYDLFSVNTRVLRIRGGKNHLGINLFLCNQKELPQNVFGKIGCVEYGLNCTAGKLYYDRIKHNNLSKDVMIHSNTGKIRTLPAPGSVRWAVAHPFQGGGFNPK